MKVTPNYTTEDLNLTKAFLKPAVLTHQMSDDACKSILSTLKLSLDNKLETPKEIWLTVKETCKKLHISKPTLYRLINSGQIKKIKVGRATRILESDVVKAFGGGYNE